MSAYPIKDFRDATSYPVWEGISAWRWEFLRRNPEYQSLFEAHKDDEIPPSKCWDFGVRALYNPMHDRAFIGLVPPGFIIELPNFEWVEKWKKDPDYSAERALQIVLGTLTRLQFHGDALATINCALPIEPQLDTIRESVAQKNRRDNRAPPLRNDRRGEWPFYLRILDGLAAGATHDEIAAALYPDRDNSYPDFAGRKRVKKAAERATFLSQTFAVKGFTPEK